MEEEEEEEKKDISEFLLNLMKNYSDSVIPSLSELTQTRTTMKQENPEEEEPSVTLSTSRTKKPRVPKTSETMSQYFSILNSMIPPKCLGASEEEEKTASAAAANGVQRKVKMEKENEEEEKDACEYLLNLMKNYSDSVIPSFSELNNPETRTTIKQEDSEDEEEEPRVLPKAPSSSKMEQERRDTMNQFFSVLPSMLPSNMIPRKVTRSNVLDGTIAYIQQLERELGALEEEKKKKRVVAAVNGVQRTEMPSVKMVVSGDMASFGLHLAVGKGLVAKILVIFEKHNAEVLTAAASTSANGLIELTVTAIVRDNVEGIKSDMVSLLGGASSSSL